MTAAIDHKLQEQLLPVDVAHKLLRAYLRYHHQYKKVSTRAKYRFEMRDWGAIQTDSKERLSLYANHVNFTTDNVRPMVGDKYDDKSLWKEIKKKYFNEIYNFNTRNIAETFFNSVYRRVVDNENDIDNDTMFVTQSKIDANLRQETVYQTFYLAPPYQHTIAHIFSYFQFDAPFQDLDRDVRMITDELEKAIPHDQLNNAANKIEVIKSIFYRNKCAYIIGRVMIDDKIEPFVLPLLHDEDGIYADAILLDRDAMNGIFSYNRSYFLMETDQPNAVVKFLKTILEHKKSSELYNSIGFVKHAKSVFYTEFQEHLELTEDKFTIAPGIKGMVMTVFTLPSYPMVFKIIKDKFTPPKNITERQVKEKYNIVSEHDRAGRMVDSYSFNYFTFPLDRISNELLEHLNETIPSKITLDKENNTLLISHLYIEKRMVPLNLFLETATKEEKTDVIVDYGFAIKELAKVNIFPGDLLLKNWGVTRKKRVVFYDYDEIEYLQDINFRKIPQSSHYEDDFASEPWFSVNPNDVFPEELMTFLFHDDELKAVFLEHHAKLEDYKYWKGIQDRITEGEVMSVFPYRKKYRFKHKNAQEKELALPV